MQVLEEQKRSKNLITSLLSRAKDYELSILLASALAAGGVWVFVEIADEVFEGETRRLDEAILLSLRNPADLAGWTAGASWALLCWAGAFLLQRRGRVKTYFEE